VFGALTLYIISTIALLALRKKEPLLERPFRVPFYPVFPIVALIIGCVSLIAMITLNIKLSIIYFGILCLTYIWFHFFVKPLQHAKQPSTNDILQQLSDNGVTKISWQLLISMAYCAESDQHR